MAVSVHDRARIGVVTAQSRVTRRRRVAIAVDGDQFSARQVDTCFVFERIERGAFAARPFRRNVIVAANRDDIRAAGAQRFEYGSITDVAGMHDDVASKCERGDARIELPVRVGNKQNPHVRAFPPLPLRGRGLG